MPAISDRPSSSAASGHVAPSGPCAVIGVHVLPEQHDLLHAARGERLRLLDDASPPAAKTPRRAYRARRRRCRTCRSPPARSGRRSAAAMLAPAGPPSARRTAADGRTCSRPENPSRRRASRLGERRARQAGGSSAARPRRRRRGARERISLPSACATQPATAILMSRPFGARALLQDAQPPDLGIDLFGRLLADVAGVEEDEVGVFGRSRPRRSRPRASTSAIRSES